MPAGEHRRLQSAASWLMATTALTGVANYAFSVAMVWMLPSRSYSLVGAMATLLLICGTVAGASAPWVLAHEVGAAEADRARRQAAVTFAMVTTGMQALGAVGVCTVIASRYHAGWSLAVVVAAVISIFFAAVAVGYLQGLQRFRLIALLRVVEVVVKIAVGVTLVAAGARAGGAIAGFAAGALAVAGVGLVIMGPDLRPRIRAVRDAALWRRARGLLAIQAGVALLAGCDVIVGSLVLGTNHTLAVYQVSLVLARIPMFVSVALSMAVFPRLSSGRPGTDATEAVRAALLLFVRIGVPVALVMATVPGGIARLIFPPAYHGITSLLPWTAAAGVGFGAVNLMTTFFQAEGRFRRPVAILMAGLSVHIGLLLCGIRLGGTRGLAVAALVGVAAVTCCLARDSGRTWPGCGRGLGRAAFPILVAGAPLVLLRDHAGVWCAWAALALGLPMVRTLVASPRPAGPRCANGRLRILHLGFEDPRRPGAGGGSVRTHEINRRLADRHDITVATASYPGCRERVEDGVRYVQVGTPRFGPWIAMLSYFTALPRVIRRSSADLVVEDFAVPFSSVAVPWMTRRPVVGVVQWLFAREKAAQYHLPFHLVERLGLFSHRRLVAVSGDLADTLRRRAPAAEVHAIPNGLDDDAFVRRDAAGGPRHDIVYLGRVETAQKGLDLLVEALALAAPRTNLRLRLAGDGPDTERIRALVRDHGLDGRVDWLGPVPYEQRLDLLASAAFVVMPSRYETFGMVAAEALAQATPVLCFDIACLRELVTEHTGVRVPAGDVVRFADALVELANDPERCRTLGEAGPASVARLRWDGLARLQEQVYRDAVARRSGAAAQDAEEETDPGLALRTTLDRIVARRTGGATGARVRMLVVGNYGSGNTGDEAILARLLQIAAGRAEVTVVSRNPPEVARLHQVPAVATTSAASLRAFLATDVLAIGGGGMFGAGLPRLVGLLPVAAIGGRLLGKDVVYQAIGAYDDMPPSVRTTLRLSGWMATAVLVRDRESHATFTGGWLGRRTRPVLVSDPAISLRPAPPEQAWQVLSDAGVSAGPPLLISLKPTPDHAGNDALVTALSEAVDWWCAHRAGDVVFVPLSIQGDYGLGRSQADAVLADRVRAGVACPDRCKVLPTGLHPALVKAVVGRGEAMVGMRLHALIFAWSMGVPLLGVSFEAKTDAFLSQARADRLACADATGAGMAAWLAAVPRPPVPTTELMEQRSTP